MTQRVRFPVTLLAGPAWSEPPDPGPVYEARAAVLGGAPDALITAGEENFSAQRTEM